MSLELREDIKQIVVKGELIAVYTVLPALVGFVLPLLVKAALTNEPFPPIEQISRFGALTGGLLGLSRIVLRMIKESPK